MMSSDQIVWGFVGLIEKQNKSFHAEMSRLLYFLLDCIVDGPRYKVLLQISNNPNMIKDKKVKVRLTKPKYTEFSWHIAYHIQKQTQPR